jgi:hypothetical protein
MTGPKRKPTPGSEPPTADLPELPERWSATLPANMRETVTPLKFSVEGEQGSEVDERIGAGDRGGSKGNAAAVQG